MAPSRPPRAISTPEGSSGAMATPAVRVGARVREQIGDDPALQMAGRGEERSRHLSSGEDGRPREPGEAISGC